MNQDQVKKALLAIEEPPLEFSVVFTGKKSGKVNGLYKPDTREILLHNRNFSSGPEGEGLLLYTAIHEYAHHFHSCARGGNLPARAHGSEFWAILHGLLEKAEAKKIYRSAFEDSPELVKLTGLIRKKYLEENGSLVKELGKYLLKASELCDQMGSRFEDYLDRVLRMPKVAAHAAIKMYQYDLNPSLGADNMRYLAGIRGAEERGGAEKALLEGKSPDSVRAALRGGDLSLPSAFAPPAEEEPRRRLEKEKRRLEKTIHTLSKRLEEVEEELDRL
ncbi:MAG: hypothetical protein LBG84_08860 [Treponema sp.]|nr:hypothetical protein [Treponema sp.]